MASGCLKMIRLSKNLKNFELTKFITIVFKISFFKTFRPRQKFISNLVNLYSWEFMKSQLVISSNLKAVELIKPSSTFFGFQNIDWVEKTKSCRHYS